MSSLPLLYAAEAKRIYIFYFWRKESRSQMREICYAKDMNYSILLICRFCLLLEMRDFKNVLPSFFFFFLSSYNDG